MENNRNKCNEQTHLVKALIEKANECYRLEDALRFEKQQNIIYRQALDSANNALNERTVQYNQVVTSKSWRHTNGLRCIYSALLKLKGKRLYVKRKYQKLKILPALLDRKKAELKNYKNEHGLLATLSYLNALLTKLIDNDMVIGDIKISIIMPVYNVNVRWLEKAIQSVLNQKYTNWELCIVDDASSYVEIKHFLKAIHDDRIHVIMLEKNSGISNATNIAAENATGDYLILLDNDDELAADATLECFKAIVAEKVDIIYSDQDIISANGEHSNPMYKPNWSLDLLYSQMYIGHLVCVKKDLYMKVGGCRSEFDGSQDYDLILRLSELKPKVKHISEILYYWRALESSTAMNPDSKPYAQIAGRKALQNHFDRVYGENYAVVNYSEHMYVYDVRYNTLHGELISIIIPTKDHKDDLKTTINSILEKSSYKNYEIIILNNRSEKEETYFYFSELQESNKNIRILDADCEFNWSKINNIGIKAAKGKVLLFLNNDVKILTSDWLERLAENALRNDIGIVGGLLLYEDGTIQHGGVVVGYGGYADHVYKGMMPIHCGTPFVSPCVNRNVTAVTGACMAVSREHLQELGLFNENFIICGSDVELCIRAYKKDYHNLYTPFVRLEHYESKSRGSYVPENDLFLSTHLYDEFLKNGDPYYNKNLSYNTCVPTPINYGGTLYGIEYAQGTIEVNQPEIEPMNFRAIDNPNKRINLILPSLNRKDVFGGIATALNFFESFVAISGWDSRIIVSDAKVDHEAIETYTPEYMFCDCMEDSVFARQIVDFSDRHDKSIPVSNCDYFVFTGWWTAYCVQQEYLLKANELGLRQNVFLYLIQDYEPGFYSWSSQYLFAELTYKSKQRQIAIFNSKELKDYFVKLGYTFEQIFVFHPILNSGLKKALPKDGDCIVKNKQILVYGRPSTARNAFALLVESLKVWVKMQADIQDWSILSAGEFFEPVNLGRGKRLTSVGKLSIENYAELLKETYAGVSLMVSPHPSYPPLEMASFGMQVVTNQFANKDLSSFNSNIHSLEIASPMNIGNELYDICKGYNGNIIYRQQNKDYCQSEYSFPCISKILDVLIDTKQN